MGQKDKQGPVQTAPGAEAPPKTVSLLAPPVRRWECAKGHWYQGWAPPTLSFGLPGANFVTSPLCFACLVDVLGSLAPVREVAPIESGPVEIPKRSQPVADAARNPERREVHRADAPKAPATGGGRAPAPERKPADSDLGLDPSPFSLELGSLSIPAQDLTFDSSAPGSDYSGGGGESGGGGASSDW